MVVNSGYCGKQCLASVSQNAVVISSFMEATAEIEMNLLKTFS